jgi:LPS O-antigen subunit length determinant protein (WzzB/FepE family)
MNNNTDLNNNDELGDEIDIKSLFNTILNGKRLVIASTALFSIIALIYSLSLSNIYQSTALLSPVEDQSASGQSINNLGGLASLAGISISSSTIANSTKAITKITTLSFFEENILPNIFLPDLMAEAKWDEESNSVRYKESIYSVQTGKWSEIPHPQKSFKAFMRKLEVSEDPMTNFLTISVKHVSPHIAKEWTELVVNQINDYFRAKDKLEAESAMNYLNTQMALTNYTEIKQVVAEILKQKMQQLALIEANEFYVFSYLDQPAVPRKKLEPSRTSICILGTVLGFMLGVLFVLVRSHFKED